jgi:signal transduction histidine kinase
VTPDRAPPRLGLRAQIALALAATLALAAGLALVAIRPLTMATSHNTRRQSGYTLTRAVAGQIALLPGDRDVQPLLENTVGPAGLSAAVLLDEDGRVRARAGDPMLPLPHPPYGDRVAESTRAIGVLVAIPNRGALVGEVSLAETPAERALFAAVLLYTAVSAAAALFTVFVLLTRYTVRPIEALTRAAERVAEGRRDVRAEPGGAGEVARAAVAFNAMTKQLTARERELSARIDALEKARRELEVAQEQLVRSERLAVVGRLAAGIAHEVGNPLAAIVGLTDVLREGGLTEEESADFATRIGREAERIHRTVRELLDYARTAPTDGEKVDAPGDVREAIAQVTRLLAPQKAMREVKLEVDASEDVPRVPLATDRLAQVLLNLTLNAADAMKRGNGTDAVARGEIVLRARVDDDRAVLEVEDTGPGIEPAMREKVFEPFFTTKAAGEGTGLGLAICAEMVAQAGGTMVALDRRDGARGARMRIELPIVSPTCRCAPRRRAAVDSSRESVGVMYAEPSTERETRRDDVRRGRALLDRESHLFGGREPLVRFDGECAEHDAVECVGDGRLDA